MLLHPKSFTTLLLNLFKATLCPSLLLPCPEDNINQKEQFDMIALDVFNKLVSPTQVHYTTQYVSYNHVFVLCFSCKALPLLNTFEPPNQSLSASYSYYTSYIFYAVIYFMKTVVSIFRFISPRFNEQTTRNYSMQARGFTKTRSFGGAWAN